MVISLSTRVQRIIFLRNKFIHRYIFKYIQLTYAKTVLYFRPYLFIIIILSTYFY